MSGGRVGGSVSRGPTGRATGDPTAQATRDSTDHRNTDSDDSGPGDGRRRVGVDERTFGQRNHDALEEPREIPSDPADAACWPTAYELSSISTSLPTVRTLRTVALTPMILLNWAASGLLPIPWV
jgi:hypothetical protein